MTQSMVIPNWHPANVANGPHGHWRTKQLDRLDANQRAYYGAKTAGWRRVDGRALLNITLVYPRKYRVDTDNLYARCKGLIDGLKGFFFEDDDTDHLDLHVTAIVEKGRKETRVVLQSANEGVSLGNGK